MQANHVSKLYLYIAAFVLGSSMLLGSISAIQTNNIQIFLSAGLLAGVLFSFPWIVAHWRFKKRLARIKQLSLFDDIQTPFQPDYRWLRIAIVVASVPILLGIYFVFDERDISNLFPGILLASLISFPFIVLFQNSRFDSIESDEINNSGWVDYSSHSAIRSQSNYLTNQKFGSLSCNIYHRRNY